MMAWTQDEITQALGVPAQRRYDDWSCSARIWTDSRSLQSGDLFVALQGHRFDGHRFVEDALAKGVCGVVIAANADRSRWPDGVSVWKVADTLRAYGDLARFHRARFSIPVIAITGSSGKTTVKELLTHILKSRYTVLASEGTENNLIGVPKTLLRLRSEHGAAVIEMGTNQPGEINRLAQIAAPDLGIITQIGTSHLERLGSREGVRDEKLALAKHLKLGGFLVLNGEDDMLSAFKSAEHVCAYVRYPDQLRCDAGQCRFRIAGQEFQLPLIGRHNVLNAAMAVRAARHLGVSELTASQELRSFKNVSGRLNLKEVEGISILDDSYNANPQSFDAALQTLASLTTPRHKVIICGDMLELGRDSERLHREAAGRVISVRPDWLIAAGTQMRFMADELVKNNFDPGRIFRVKDSDEAGRVAKERLGPGDLVLIKGSRGMAMEKVISALSGCKVSTKG